MTKADTGVLHQLVASPAGDRLAFANNRHELWLLDVGGEPKLLDRSIGERIDDLAFSPDGRWLAYVWSPKTHTAIIRLAECETGRIIDATSALREDRSPAWDPDGNYLYFLSTRDFHPVYDALQFELSFPEAWRPYLVTLRENVANPFTPKPAPLHKPRERDDDEDDADDKKEAKPEVIVDADGLPRRMLAFPVDEGSYDRIVAAKGRAIFSRFPVRGIRPDDRDQEPQSEGELYAYDFEQQRGATLATEIDDFVIGPDARTLVYFSHGKLRAIDAGGDLPEDGDDDKPAPEVGRRTGWLDLARISVLVEPLAEWRQMLREAWRLQRENFWDPQMSGIDWDAVLARYEALLPKVRSRNELSDVIWEMQGELGTSHAYETGGDRPLPPQYKRGFLGADLAWDERAKAYRVERILRGDPWNRDADSALAEPGIDVKEGDLIVAIGGRAVTAHNGPAALLVNQAGRDVVLSVVRGNEAPRRVLVRTLRDERMLRYRAWVDANRADVHERTKGRVGYVHVPDMGPWGFAEFHRGYLSEFDRDGLIVDVRYNRGGHVSALLLEKLARKRVGYDVSRWAPPFPYPEESVGGPIVAVTNQFAGSDGDIFSHCFKLYGLGPLVGDAHVGRRHRHQPAPPPGRRHANDAAGVFVLVHRRGLGRRKLRHGPDTRSRHRPARHAARSRSAAGRSAAADRRSARASTAPPGVPRSPEPRRAALSDAARQRRLRICSTIKVTPWGRPRTIVTESLPRLKAAVFPGICIVAPPSASNPSAASRLRYHATTIATPSRVAYDARALQAG